MPSLSPTRSFALILACLGATLSLACSSSTSTPSDGGSLDATKSTTSSCAAFGQGYVCQSGSTCSAGYVNEQDLNCGTGGDLCCGPVGEGGVDASDDANVFVDGRAFETGADVATKKPVDAGADVTTKTPVDAGVDASTHVPSDAGKDAAVDAPPGQ
jgi:hypothetical protein